MSERNGQSKLEIRGTGIQRRKTLKYVKCVMAQRVGPVHVEEDDADDDLTLVEVPTECVGFVTGKQGNFLRTMEDEWGVIMFFAEFKGARFFVFISPTTCVCMPKQLSHNTYWFRAFLKNVRG